MGWGGCSQGEWVVGPRKSPLPCMISSSKFYFGPVKNCFGHAGCSQVVLNQGGAGMWDVQGHIHFYLETYVGEQKSDFGLQGGNTVHKRILEFILYYIRFDLQGGDSPPPCPPPTPTYAWRLISISSKKKPAQTSHKKAVYLFCGTLNQHI